MRLPSVLKLLLVLFASAYGNKQKLNRCFNKALNSGLVTNDFPTIVMHGIHSLTMENLRHYFDPFAPSTVKIPVVNFNLSSEEPAVLSSPPSLPLTNPFTSPAMRALDQVLSHMTDNDFGIRNAPPMERVVHALHMLEIWEWAADHFRQLRESRPGILQDICPCLADVEHNNITTAMTFLSRKMRNREAIWRYGSPAAYTNFFFRPSWRPIRPVAFESIESEFFVRSLGQVVSNTDAPATNLTNEAEWQIWKEKMDMRPTRESHSRQLAIFLYCALM